MVSESRMIRIWTRPGRYRGGGVGSRRDAWALARTCDSDGWSISNHMRQSQMSTQGLDYGFVGRELQDTGSSRGDEVEDAG